MLFRSISQIQKYNPIFSKLFDDKYIQQLCMLDNISLNNKFHFYDTENVFDSKTKNIISKNVFIKYSPLLDPIRYMIGKYDIDHTLTTLPIPYNNNDNNIHHKLIEPNNASYVDSFFSFLTSKLLDKHNFIHGIDF